MIGYTVACGTGAGAGAGAAGADLLGAGDPQLEQKASPSLMKEPHDSQNITDLPQSLNKSLQCSF